ncbi:MAG: DUF445 domain-containing protein [Mobilicoccus sp.]|nr:DUF445 domain-containing protein [Mobilicoccus sp.]
MTSIALTAADESRRRGLVRMRTVASSLFVLAAVVFVLTLHRDGWLGYVNATAEAAMVGAIADWFAVTALFRHPLGLPIPHTALVPRKKDVFAKSLEDFVVGHFLTGDAARERYLSTDATPRMGRWLTTGDNAEKVVEHAASLTTRGLAHISEDEVRDLLEESVLPRLVREPIAPVAGTLLEQVVDDDVHRTLVDLCVVEAHDWLLDNPEKFASVVGERAPTWSPLWVNSLVVDRLHTEALRWVRDVRDTPRHRMRLAIDDLLRDLARNLCHDPATMQRAESLKETFLTHPQTMETATSVWTVLRRTLEEALADPQGRLRTRVRKELHSLGERLQHDADLRERVDRRVGDIIAGLVDTYSGELAPVISQVIERWDGKEAADRIELHVGRDLQFIRINGTVIGGLVGFLIHAFSQAMA